MKAYALLLSFALFTPWVMAEEEILYDGQKFPLNAFSESRQITPSFQLSTRDGLRLLLSSEGEVWGIQERSKAYGCKPRFITGFFVHDVKKGVIYSLRGKVERLAKGKLRQTATSKEGHLRFEAVYESNASFLKIRLKNIQAVDLLAGRELSLKRDGKLVRIPLKLADRDITTIEVKEVKTMKPLHLERFKYPRLILEPTREEGDFDSEMVDCFKIVLDYDKGIGEPYQKAGYYYAVYTGFDGESYRCGLLRSKDLLNWERLGMVLDIGREGEFDAGSAGGGVVFKWRDKFYMLYTGYPLKGYENGPGKIGLAISDDLLHWKKLGVILEPEERFPWEAGGLYQSFPLLFQNKLYLFYNAKNKEVNWTEQIGMAISQDPQFLKWEKHKDNPILPVGPPRSWDSRFASDPWVIRIADKWHMFYYGFNGVHAQDGVALSNDLIKWEKSPFNPILAYGEQGSYDEIHAHKPCVIFKGGIHYHFYTAVGSKGRCIALATSVPLVQEEVQ